MAEDEKVDEHPEDVKPLGDSHPHYTRGEKRAIRILSLGLVITLVLIPIVSVTAFSPLGNVFLGLSPLLLTLVFELILVGNHYKRHVLWMVLVFVHIAAMGYLWLLNPMLQTAINIPQALSTTVLIGALFTLLAFLADAPEDSSGKTGSYRMPLPQEFSMEKLPEFVQSIEDKAKALNFAIGRVYRNSNGGSAKLRERLRIPREWYNEFSEAEEEERVNRAKIIVKKIHDRLLLYQEPEKDVFSKAEMEKLKNAQRKEDGSSSVLDVLVKTDSDPVEYIYQQAVDTCENVLKGLG